MSIKIDNWNRNFRKLYIASNGNVRGLGQKRKALLTAANKSGLNIVELDVNGLRLQDNILTIVSKLWVGERFTRQVATLNYATCEVLDFTSKSVASRENPPLGTKLNRKGEGPGRNATGHRLPSSSIPTN